MADYLLSDYIAEWADIYMGQRPYNNVLFEKGILSEPPKVITKAIKTFKTGERVRIPAYDLSTGSFEPQKSDGSEYTANRLNARRIYGINVLRAIRFDWYDYDQNRNEWDENIADAIKTQMPELIEKELNDTMVSVLTGSVPNELDVSVATGTQVPLSPDVIIDAANITGDKMDNLSILVCHSDVWADLQKSGYAQFADATLINDTVQGTSVWTAAGRIVYVTDSLPVDTTTADYEVYDSYIIAPKQLIIPPTAPTAAKQSYSAKDGLNVMRTDISFLPHLNGVSYKTTAPTDGATNADFEDPTNWELGTTDAKYVKCVRIKTNVNP